MDAHLHQIHRFREFKRQSLHLVWMLKQSLSKSVVINSKNQSQTENSEPSSDLRLRTLRADHLLNRWTIDRAPGDAEHNNIVLTPDLNLFVFKTNCLGIIACILQSCLLCCIRIWGTRHMWLDIIAIYIYRVVQIQQIQHIQCLVHLQPGTC